MVSQLARLSVAVLLFRDDEDHESTRASSRSAATSALAASAGAAADHLRLLLLLGHVEVDDLLPRGEAGGRRHLPDLLLLGRHDALERRVAQLVDAALDRQQRGQRQRDPLEPAALELALHAHRRPAARRLP